MQEPRRRTRLPFTRKRNGQEPRWQLECQGNLLAVAESNAHFQPEPGKRGKCEEFSDSSRRYLLKLLARVDWKRVGLSQFITFTYPDLAWDAEHTNRTYQRSRLFAWVERQLGQQRSMLWRVEWKPRLSGKCEGEIAPHFHCCVFNCRYLDWKATAAEWARLLAVKWVDVEGELSRGTGAARYCAKYCGKVHEQDGLGLASYLNVVDPGRPWGWTRKKLMPWAAQETANHLTEDEIARASAVATHILGRDRKGGFTILDEHAEKMSRYILGSSDALVDRAPRKRYRKRTTLREGRES